MFPSAAAFSDAAAALYAQSPLTRTSIKYRVDGKSGAALTLRATDDTKVSVAFRRPSSTPPPWLIPHLPTLLAQTLTYTGRSRDDLRFMDKLSLLALHGSFSAAAATAAATASSRGGASAPAPRPHPEGSGAQRRKAARTKAASAGVPLKPPRVSKSRLRARERAAVRREERKLAEGAGAI